MMTEKRFTETVSTGIVTDNVTGKEYNCEMRIDDELLELLNELHEENEQLRIEKDTIQKQHSYELNKKLEYKSKLIDLKKENEQLKQALIHAAFDKEWK